MNRFETSVKTLASDFPSWCRIPHLENNFYIYGGGPKKIEPLPVYERSKFLAGDLYKKSSIEGKSGLYGSYNSIMQKVHKGKEDFMELKGSLISNTGKKSFDSLNTRATLSYKNQNEPEKKTTDKQLEVNNISISRSKSYEHCKQPEEKYNNKTNHNDLKHSDSDYSYISSNISNKFELGSLIERNSSIRSGSNINNKSEGKASNASISANGKIFDKLPNFIDKNLKIGTSKNSPFIDENILANENVKSEYPLLKQSSFKSEPISNKNSFFKVNLDKTEGKLTKGELENMEVYSILRKNSKNTEPKNKKETIEEKPNSTSFDSERKLIQEKLIEDFKRESLRRELSRQNSIKYTGQKEPFTRTNSRKQTHQSKYSEKNEYSNRSHSSKHLSNKSCSHSDSEYSNPTYSTHRISEINKRETPDPRLTNWFSYQNSKPRNFFLSTKQSDHNYHQSTFNHKVRYMGNQPYTYSPNSKSTKSFPKFK